ncbi:MAG: OmpH family outer membrane protein [Bacteroidetes bacterium]|nr:OmpH family outer membrane protein [Bacteroidota bacterium]
MKFLKTLLLIALVIPASLMAQTHKFGHINTNELLSKMPKVVEAQKQLDTYKKEYEDQIKELQSEFEKKYQEMQAGKMTDAQKSNREKELQQLQQRIYSVQQDARDNMEKKQEEIMGPIITKVKDAIKAVAKEGKYNYIFEAATLLYADESEDVSGAVKKKLGLL